MQICRYTDTSIIHLYCVKRPDSIEEIQFIAKKFKTVLPEQCLHFTYMLRAKPFLIQCRLAKSKPHCYQCMQQLEKIRQMTESRTKNCYLTEKKTPTFFQKCHQNFTIIARSEQILPVINHATSNTMQIGKKNTTALSMKSDKAGNLRVNQGLTSSNNKQKKGVHRPEAPATICHIGRSG